MTKYSVSANHSDHAIFAVPVGIDKVRVIATLGNRASTPRRDDYVRAWYKSGESTDERDKDRPGDEDMIRLRKVERGVEVFINRSAYLLWVHQAALFAKLYLVLGRRQALISTVSQPGRNYDGE